VAFGKKNHRCKAGAWGTHPGRNQEKADSSRGKRAMVKSFTPVQKNERLRNDKQELAT
jgi:hypothetical protein